MCQHLIIFCLVHSISVTQISLNAHIILKLSCLNRQTEGDQTCLSAIFAVFFNSRHIFRLQIESSDDTRGNDECCVLNNSNDFITHSSMPAVKQVRNFVSDSFNMLSF